MICLQIASPSPEPCTNFEELESACQKGSNSCGIDSSRMPIPLSITEKVTMFSGDLSTRVTTNPPIPGQIVNGGYTNITLGWGLAVLSFVAIALLRLPLILVLLGAGSVACIWAYRQLGISQAENATP